MVRLSDQCRAAAANCRHFAEGAALLRAWARQQQLSRGADGLNSTVLTMMLVHLVEMGQVVSSSGGLRRVLLLQVLCTSSSAGTVHWCCAHMCMLASHLPLACLHPAVALLHCWPDRACLHNLRVHACVSVWRPGRVSDAQR